MSAVRTDPEQAPRSRRALLAAAAGGAAALAATLARPATTEAAAGDPVLAGRSTGAGGASTRLSNTSNTKTTLSVTQNGRSTAIAGRANDGTAGRFTNWTKNKWSVIVTNLAGNGGSGGGLKVDGGANVAVRATSTKGVAVYASAVNAEGVIGESQTNYGVYGESQDDIGVYGSSTTGWGLFASSSSSFAGVFGGPTRMDSYLEWIEGGTPAAPAANSARVFVRDNGAGKTQLCVRFPTGAVQVIATEP